MNAARTGSAGMAVAAIISAATACYVLPYRLLVEHPEVKLMRLETEAILASRAPMSPADDFNVYVQRDEIEGKRENNNFGILE
jgi:hypothetical protein